MIKFCIYGLKIFEWISSSFKYFWSWQNLAFSHILLVWWDHRILTNVKCSDFLYYKRLKGCRTLNAKNKPLHLFVLTFWSLFLDPRLRNKNRYKIYFWWIGGNWILNWYWMLLWVNCNFLKFGNGIVDM